MSWFWYAVTAVKIVSGKTDNLFPQGIGPERGVRVGVEPGGRRWIGLPCHQPGRTVVRVTVAPVVNRDHIQQHDIPIGRRNLAQRTGEGDAYGREHAPVDGRHERQMKKTCG
uniref:Uncharacterized protein n=1 Tax=Anopheles melas TaxID=34690 RepID=A0A182TZ12_9DIPT